jgi:hypothetical protein
MAEVVKPWWQAPSGYMFCIVEGGFYFDDIDGSCFPREDEATVDPMFIEALMQYKQREYPYFGRGRAMKIVDGQRVPPAIEYIAELKSGMLAELENTSVFLCPAAVVRFDSKPYKLVKSASHIDMKPYWSSKGTVKVRNPATARDLLDEFAKDNGIRIIEYDEYLPFREYYKF